MRKLKMKLVLGVCLVLVLVSHSFANLLTNGGFEDDLTGWRLFVAPGATGTATVETTDVYEGVKAARFAVTDHNDADVFFDRWDNPVDVEPRKYYKCTVAAKKINSTDTALQFLASDLTADGSFITDHFEYVYPSETEYGLHTLYFTADANAARTVIGFRIKDGTNPNLRANGEYLIDDVQIEQLPDLWNGGFEDGLVGWRLFIAPGASGTLSLETTDVNEGVNAARFAVTDHNNADVFFDRWDYPVAVEPGKVYKVTVAAKKINLTDTALQFLASDLKADGSFITDHFEYVYPSTSEYGLYTLYFTANAEAAKTAIGFRIKDGTDTNLRANGEYLIDDVQIEELTGFTGLWNGGFEDDFLGWRTESFSGGVAMWDIVTDSNAYAGNKAARFEVIDETGDNVLDRWDNPVPLDGMRSVKVTAYLKKDVPYDQDFMCHFFECDEAFNWLGGSTIVATYQHFGLTDTYQKFEVFYPVVRPGAAMLTLGFKPSWDGAASFGAIIVDEVSLEEAPLLPNGDMEMGTRMWTCAALNGEATLNTTVETIDVYEGLQAVRFDSNNTDNSFVTINRWYFPVPVTGGEAYKCTFAAKKINTTDTMLTVWAADLRADSTWITDHFECVYPSTSDYSLHSLYFTAHGDARSTAIGFRIEDPNNPGIHISGEYLLDDVQVEELTGLWNGDFEDGLVGWRTLAFGEGAGTTTIETTDVYEGVKAARFAITDSSNDVFFDRWDFPTEVELGETYKCTVAAKKINLTDTVLQIVASDVNESGSFITDHFVFVSPSTTEYGLYNLVFTPDANAARTVVGFRIKDGTDPNNRANGEYLIDDVRFYNTNSLEAVDLDGNEVIGLGDIGILSQEWLDVATGACDQWFTADINLDCIVNLLDFAEIASNWLDEVVE